MSYFTSPSSDGLPWYWVPVTRTVSVPNRRQHFISGEMIIQGEFKILGEAKLS